MTALLLILALCFIPAPHDARHPLPDEGPATPARLGIASWMPARFGDRYLALPGGPGLTVRLCGPLGCLTATSNDAGPDKAMQRRGRIADLSRAMFARICGDPAAGLCRISLEVIA